VFATGANHDAGCCFVIHANSEADLINGGPRRAISRGWSSREEEDNGKNDQEPVSANIRLSFCRAN